jgi:hypothetical protein
VLGDVDAGDRGRQVRPSVVAVEVAGRRVLDGAGAPAPAPGWQQRGQDGATDGPEKVGLAGLAGVAIGTIPSALMSWSRAACRAVVKLARSGLVSGRDSTAVTMAIRSSW